MSVSSDTPDHLDAAKWADMLGLVPLAESRLKIQDESERELVFQNRFYLQTRIHQISSPAAASLQMDLWANFTSKYLPSLVDRILDLPPPSARLPYGVNAYPILNIYHTTLKFADTAYLAKFMTSTHPIAKGGKRLPLVIAERVVEFGPSWRQKKDPMYEGCIHRVVTTLIMLVIAAKRSTIPEPTRSKLVHLLDTWARYDAWSPESKTPDNNLSRNCIFLSQLFAHGADLRSAIKQSRHALKWLDSCALPTCEETKVKVCSRCKTVAYCSNAHQIQHWKQHKRRCFETVY